MIKTSDALPMDAQQEFDQEPQGKRLRVDKQQLNALKSSGRLNGSKAGASSGKLSSDESARLSAYSDGMLEQMEKDNPEATRESLIEELRLFGGL